jgi:hypothetical protein
MVLYLIIFGLAYLQHFWPTTATFTSCYFSLIVFNFLLAIAISVYISQPMSIPISKKPAKWSLPGTALFGGHVSQNYFMVVWCCILLSSQCLAGMHHLLLYHAYIVCQLHGCGGFGTDTLEWRWHNAIYTWQYTSIRPMPGSPLNWGFLPKVEPLKPIPGSSWTCKVILQHVGECGYCRPSHNVK